TGSRTGHDTEFSERFERPGVDADVNPRGHATALQVTEQVRVRVRDPLDAQHIADGCLGEGKRFGFGELTRHVRDRVTVWVPVWVAHQLVDAGEELIADSVLEFFGL